MPPAYREAVRSYLPSTLLLAAVGSISVLVVYYARESEQQAKVAQQAAYQRCAAEFPHAPQFSEFDVYLSGDDRKSPCPESACLVRCLYPYRSLKPSQIGLLEAERQVSKASQFTKSVDTAVVAWTALSAIPLAFKLLRLLGSAMAIALRACWRFFLRRVQELFAAIRGDWGDR